VTGAIGVSYRYFKKAGQAVLHTAARTVDAARSYVARLLFGGRLGVYALALITLGVVAFFAVPRLPLLLTAVAGWMAALLASVRTFLQPAQLPCDLETQ
jgi:hypothetical protein